MTDVTAREQQHGESRTSGSADNAKDKAQQVTAQGQEKARDAAEQAKQKASEAGEGLQEKAEEVKGQVGGRVRQEIDTRTADAGEQVNGFADALRRTSSTLREEGKEAPANLADTAAEKIEQIGGYLRSSDADRLLDDAESYARRQPWVVAGAGAVLGLAAARFLKASSERRHTQRTSGARYPSNLPPVPSPERQLPTGAPRGQVGDLQVEPDPAADPLDPLSVGRTPPPAAPSSDPLGAGTRGVAPTDTPPIAPPVTPPVTPPTDRPGGTR